MTDSLSEKEKKAIERLKAFEPEDDAYWLAYSGGKDSDCIRILAQLANVRHEIHHSLTTVDAPETVRYVKSIPGIIIDKSYYKDEVDRNGNPKQITMWNLIVKKKFPPIGIKRYCCEMLKEGGGKGRMKITGVRWDESKKRKENGGLVKIIGKKKTVQKIAEQYSADYRETKQGGTVLNLDNAESRRVVEHCYRTTSTMLNPIIDWSDSDVWDFLHHYGCKSNPLYQCGENRIGCIGCPLQRGKGMQAEFVRYPKYRAAYVRAFDRMLKAREEAGKENYSWNTGEDVMRWWTQDDFDQNQMSFFDPDLIGGAE